MWLLIGGAMEKSKGKRYKFYINFLTITLIILTLLTCICEMSIKSAYATNETYSNVLTDLQKDENFNVEDYPVKSDDYSLDIIQIAETTGCELLIYVYQPSEKLKATSINISTGINDNKYYINYKLTYLNSDSVFYKYKVENFKIKEDVVRYYDISSIFRNFDEKIDKNTENDNKFSEVSFEIGQLWTACTINNEVTYTCVESETLLITDRYVGYIRFPNGFFLVHTSVDSHYIAFSTDRKIDKLLEADVYYMSADFSSYYSLYTGWNDVQLTDFKENYVSLKYNQVASNDPSWLGGQLYSWQRIEKVSDFISNKDNNLSEEVKNQIKDKQYVLRFAETKFDNGGVSDYIWFTRVSEVTILRLKFETNGIVYNLGVVDNKTTGSRDPSNNQNLSLLDDVLEVIILVAFIIVGLFFLGGIAFLCYIFREPLSKFIGFIWKGICCVGKGIWWLITAPFELFK